MSIIENAPLVAAGFIVLIIVIWILTMRRIVEMKYAHVVVNKKGSKIYSADRTVSQNGAIYYEIPSWIPALGCIVKEMSLEIIQITVRDYETFAKENARFRITVSVYCRINDVTVAAQRFPGTTMDDFRDGMSGIIYSAVRKTTANYAIEDIISRHKEIGDQIREEIRSDFEAWGVFLTNVAVETIADAKGTTVIQDIAAKKEAQIKSVSRKEIAVQEKTADIVEAENREAAEKRKIMADEQIAVREQEKSLLVAEKQRNAVEKELEVKRIQLETTANIEANASIRTAEGVRQSKIVEAEGAKQAVILQGEGDANKIRATGIADADVIRVKKIAEAEGLSAIADAQKKLQESAKEIQIIDMLRVVGLAKADALKAAKITYIGSGKPESFMDLFTASGGMSLAGSAGAAMSALGEIDPATRDAISDIIKKIGTLEQPAVLAGAEEKPTTTGPDILSMLSENNVLAALDLIKTTNPDLYKKLVKKLSKQSSD